MNSARHLSAYPGQIVWWYFSPDSCFAEKFFVFQRNWRGYKMGPNIYLWTHLYVLSFFFLFLPFSLETVGISEGGSFSRSLSLSRCHKHLLLVGIIQFANKTFGENATPSLLRLLSCFRGNTSRSKMVCNLSASLLLFSLKKGPDRTFRIFRARRSVYPWILCSFWDVYRCVLMRFNCVEC